MNVLVKISDGKYPYDLINLQAYALEHNDYTNFGYLCINGTTKFKLDCAFVHYLVKELKLCDYYRQQFIINWFRKQKTKLSFILQQTRKDLIDYKWNDRVYFMVRERCELDHTLSWLSTLGGAFSALGDYFENCAETAGKISINQLKLALRLGDPCIASRCLLYLSLSLIQKKQFRRAKNIIQREYYLAKTENVIDHRLIKMCKGIWSKLQYEHSLYVKNKRPKYR